MVQVIINNILPKTQIVATAGQTIFDTFPAWTANAASDVIVYQTPAATPANDVTQKLLTSQYNVTFIGSDLDVRVTLVTPANAGDIITIVRATPADRENLYTNTNFTPSMLNNDFGILTLVDQQAELMNEQITPHYNLSEEVTIPRDVILPALDANEFWIMNNAHTAIIAANIDDVTIGVSSITAGLGLTAIPTNPITATGTIEFAAMAPFTFWANNTAGIAQPTQVSLSSISGSVTSITQGTGITLTPNPITIAGTVALANIPDQTFLANTSGISAPPVPTPLAGIGLPAHVANQMLITDAANILAWIGPQVNGIIITSASGLPSFNQTLPSAVQTNITRLGLQAIDLNMNTHFIHNVIDPIQQQDAATKNYVDLVAAGLNVLLAVYAASTANLNTTYAPGVGGVGATLTNTGALIAFAIDGVNPPINSRILVKDQASTLQNGIYILTTVGSGAVAWVLTRATDYDQPSEITPGDLIIVNNGSLNAGTSWIETATVTTVGVSPILFSQFTFASSAFLLKSANLSDVNNATISFNNISPTTTKGDLITRDSTNNVRLGVGANDTLLQADSTTATGVKWVVGTGTTIPVLQNAPIINQPRIDAIYDQTFNSQVLKIAALTGAVNFLEVRNSSTGVQTALITDGTDTDVNMSFRAKGAGSFAFYNAFGVTTSQLLVIAGPSNSVNAIAINSAATSQTPSIVSTGSDANVNLIVNTKGAGTIALAGGNGATNGNIANFIPVASSVNYLEFDNAIATASPTISAVGTDTNIKPLIQGKGTGGVRIKGTSTNDNAAAGEVGELISNVIPSASPVTFTNVVAGNLTSINLTAGDWDVYGNINGTSTGTGITLLYVWISLTSATLPDISLLNSSGGLTSTNNIGISAPYFRASLAGTTTLYLSGLLAGGATLQGRGGIYARRVR